MSIEVKNLVKTYGKQKAVDNISFDIGKNEIVGFLGPNGAGKSTTLKIATGYLPPTSGSVKINGIDIGEDPIEVKKQLGYLPEHNPLYLDMFVHEYLRFSGRFYGLKGMALKRRCSEVIEMCQLSIEQNKRIGQLSKGYRQRVGLAQALLHEPSVLILDEPTTGLDPNQIVEVRELIKSISHERTVLFSTHIMQEVVAICDRVIIINKGQLVADDKLSHIMELSKKQILEVEFAQSVDKEVFADFEGIKSLRSTDGLRYLIELEKKEDARPALMKYAARLDLPIIGIKLQESTMEEIFSALTQSEKHA